MVWRTFQVLLKCITKEIKVTQSQNLLFGETSLNWNEHPRLIFITF